MREPEIRRMPSLISAVLPSAAILVTVALGLFAGTYVQYVLCLALVASIVGAGLVLLVGLGRVIMLASGAMMAIGAYGSTLLVEFLAVPYLLAVALAGVCGAVAGVVLAIPAVRFKGHNLAMVTLVFQAIAIIVIRELSFTGGSEGLRVGAATVFGRELITDGEYLLLIGICAAVIIFAITALQQGHFGRVLKAIADTEIGAEAYGVDISRYRVAAFAVTSCCLAIAGGLLAPRLFIIDPETFGVLASVTALAYPIVGGMTTVWGGILGGMAFSTLPEVLRPLAEYKAFIFAMMVLVVMVFFPRGIVQILTYLFGLLSPLKRLRRSHPLAQMAQPVGRETGIPSTQPMSTRKNVISGGPRDDLPTALEIDGASVAFGKLQAVGNVNLTVREGTIHGLIGPNGAGKTSLFNIISGFLDPDSGEIRFFGQGSDEGVARGYVGKGVTRTFQHVAVYGSLTCLDNVMLGLGKNLVGRSFFMSLGETFGSRESDRQRQAAADTLALVGLEGKAHELAGTLSLGDQRRLEIARAIVSRPRLLLLDEPMSGVSIEEEQQLTALLIRLNAEFGLTMFLIEHNIRFVLDICHALSVMAEGEIVAEGAPREVIDRPEVRQIYFGTEATAAAPLIMASQSEEF